MQVSYREVLRCLLEGVKWLPGPEWEVKVTGKSGISQARAEPAGSPGAGGQPVADAGLDRALRYRYVALFALPLFGRAALRRQLPRWLKVAAASGLASSLVALLISVYPVVDVVSRLAFAGKICAVVVVSNMAGVLIYRLGQSRRA